MITFYPSRDRDERDKCIIVDGKIIYSREKN